MSTPRPELLIVDDHPRNLDVLEAMLAPLDCELIRASSAEEALLALLRHDVAAIVLDIRMPGMDGFELARLIKQRKRSQHTPILFLTAHSVDETDVLQGYGAGGVDYLSKPIDAAILRSKVGVFLDLFAKTRALARLNEALQSEVAARERAQAELVEANAELERRVQERTAAFQRAHRGVRENEERLRMALEVARVAAWDWDLVTGAVTWSTDPEDLFGLPHGMLGPDLRLGGAIHPDDRRLVDDAVDRARRTHGYEAEYRLCRPDGSVVWITERGRVVQGDDGSQRMVGISRDVSAETEAALERDRLLAETRLARDHAERQSRLKDEFLASLSHELRTPMNVILGWLSTLETGKPIKDVYAALAIVRRNAVLQARLIDDLLDASRLLSGSMAIERDRVDVPSLVRATLEGLQPAAGAKNVQLMASVDTGVGPVLGDARRLQQVFWNLAHNGIKFTPAGGRVEIRVYRDDQYVEVIVHDSGRGISPEFLPRMFSRFQQEAGGLTSGTAGLGLGLAIAKELVELHGGTIAGRSEGLGSGATFVVRLPVAPMARHVDGASSDADPVAQRSAS